MGVGATSRTRIPVLNLSKRRILFDMYLLANYYITPSSTIAAPATMNLQKMSPTANLLRTSRVFSLPQALPKPSHDYLSFNKTDSDTATLPYPTHATIETTQSSLSKGDWGLKQSLPRRSTAFTSTPLIRITGDISSIDHITDFESAADHTLTLRKWQEMNVPISHALPPQRNIQHPSAYPESKSVFESYCDNTEKGSGRVGHGRWKYEGPWLAGKTEGEFQKFLQQKIKKRKPEFREFLRKHLSEAKEIAQKRNARERGDELEQGVIKISESEIDVFIKKLRQDLGSLRKLIEKFLDLPNYAELSGELSTNPDSNVKSREKNFLERGPPQTHPSAGLSYLRTASHIHNHPILGPQQQAPPVPSRVIRPQTLRDIKNARALLGVAGVVARDNRNTSNKDQGPPGLTTFEPDAPGGAKIWVHPEHASIDPRGRIKLLVHSTDKHTVAIYEGVVENSEEPDPPKGPRTFPSTPTSTLLRDRKKQSYGLEGSERATSNGRARPIPNASEDDILAVLRVGVANGS